MSKVEQLASVPMMPPSKGQSPILFEDGYAEGWAKCEQEYRALLRQQDALLRQALEALEKVYTECEVRSDDGERAMIKASNAIRELEEHLK